MPWTHYSCLKLKKQFHTDWFPLNSYKCQVSCLKFEIFPISIKDRFPLEKKNDFKNRFLQIDNRYKESDSTVCSIWIYYDKRPISTSQWNTHTHTYTHTDTDTDPPHTQTLFT